MPYYTKHAWMAAALICLGLVSLPAIGVLTDVPGPTGAPKVEAAPTQPAAKGPPAPFCTGVVPGEHCQYPKYRETVPAAQPDVKRPSRSIYTGLKRPVSPTRWHNPPRVNPGFGMRGTLPAQLAEAPIQFRLAEGVA